MNLNNSPKITSTTSNIRKIAAFVVPLMFLSVSIWLMVWLTDGLLLRNSNAPFQAKRAVLAIRDSVPSFQQFGTELFTDPYLEAYYDKVYYFTQKSSLDQKELIVASLEKLTQNYETVDIFLLAHTNRYLYWFKTLKPKQLKKIRLVYNTGCHNAEQGKDWLKLGADAYIGHQGKTSLSPFFYVYFLRRWVSGYALQQAVEESNKMAKTEIDLLKDLLPDPGEMDYVEQTYGHLFGNAKLKIDHKP